MSQNSPALIPPRRRRLCAIGDIPDRGSKGFPPAPGSFVGLFAVREGAAIRVYVNACPHIGIALDWVPDRFLSDDGTLIVCPTHGAEFRVEDGYCIRGPCQGDTLEAVAFEIEDGAVLVAEDAGV